MAVKHKTREAWLVGGMELMTKEFFKAKGYKLPKKMRASCGFPRGHAKAIGQCWDKGSSADATYEMFICPTQAEPVKVLGILLHEMIHACVGLEVGHKGPFRKMALEFGLCGKMTATTVEEETELHRTLSKMAGSLGKYPHAPMRKQAKGSKPNKWVRYVSVHADKYRVVINCDRVEEHGVPRDPWGDEMELL